MHASIAELVADSNVWKISIQDVTRNDKDEHGKQANQGAREQNPNPAPCVWRDGAPELYCQA